VCCHRPSAIVASCAQSYLACKPLLQDGIEPGQPRDPGCNLSSKGFGERRCAHGPALDDVVIQQSLGLIQWAASEDVGAGGLPFCQLKVELLPVGAHLVQGLLNGPFPAGLLTDLLNGLQADTTAGSASTAVAGSASAAASGFTAVGYCTSWLFRQWG